MGNKSQAQVTEDNVCLGLDKQVPGNWNLTQAFKTYPSFSLTFVRSPTGAEESQDGFSVEAGSRPTFGIVYWPLWWVYPLVSFLLTFVHAINSGCYMFLNIKWNYKWKMLPPACSAFVLPTEAALGVRSGDTALCWDLQGAPTFPECSGSSWPHICVHMFGWDWDIRLEISPAMWENVAEQSSKPLCCPWHSLSEVQGGFQECRQGHVGQSSSPLGIPGVVWFYKAELPCAGWDRAEHDW